MFRRRGFCTVLLLIVSLLLTAVPTSHAQGQPPITSSGLNTLVSPPTTLPNGKINYDITGGTRPLGANGQLGPNLFHSFGLFNVPTNNIANFLNTPVNGSLPFTSNILARVTGENGNPTPSNIFGTIQTTGFGNANLFLINPAGIIFSPTATLNVGGSVNFATADYLRLADVARFNAIPDLAQDTLLSAAPVVAFGFLGPTAGQVGPYPAPISVQGASLQVPQGQALSLVGGAITIQNGTITGGQTTPSTLIAPSGRINIASVASGGEVVIGTSPTQPALDVAAFPQLGQVTISGQSLLDASGPVNGPGGGTVLIRGGRLMMDHSTIMSNTRGSTNGFSSGIDLNMTEDLSITGNGGSSSASTAISVTTSGAGHAGDLVITAPSLELNAGAVIKTVTSNGQAGNITLNVDSLTLSGLARIESRAGNFLFPTQAQGGNIMVNGAAGTGHPSKLVMISGGDGGDSASGLQSIAMGPGVPLGGNIAIQSDTLTMKDGAVTRSRTSGQGAGGTVLVEVGNLTLTGGAGIVSDSSSTGAGGTITVRGEGGEGTLAKSVQISGTLVSGSPSSGIFSHSNRQGTLNLTPQAGGITVDGDVLTLTGGGRIQSGSFSQQGGPVTVTATQEIDVLSGSSISSLGIVRDVGTLSVSSPVLKIENGLIVSATPFVNNVFPPDFVGADILLQAEQLALTQGARIDTGTTSVGKAGTVTVQGLGGVGTQADLVTISGTTATGQPSGIFSNTGKLAIPGFDVQSNPAATGAGGAVSIKARSVIVQDGGTISAASSSASALAQGGSITIDANQVQIANGASITSASTQAGGGAPGGSIEITAQTLKLDRAQVSTSSAGLGNAGDIRINPDVPGNTFEMRNNSRLSTSAELADGGNIQIHVKGMLREINSLITSSVGNPTKTTTIGGNIFIDPDFVILQNGKILANAFAGTGGNITIISGVFLADPSSLVDASSQRGISGTVDIQAPVQNLSGALVPLSQGYLAATSLLAQRCAAQYADGQFSTFVLSGRDGLPPGPGGLLPISTYVRAPGAGTKASAMALSSQLGNESLDVPLLNEDCIR